MANLLQLQSGEKSFGTKKIFIDAGFSVNEDEHIGVIGPNGAGKTTLFKILTGQESLDSGEIIKSKSLRLGYLAQHDHWEENETAEDYLSRDCVTPIWELKALGKKLGLSEELFEKPILSLSGGYRMRCKLLYLLGQEPNLMLLDEPTNYLDLETTLVLEKFLQNYRGAFLLISHDREFLRRTTNHIMEVEQGDITKYNGNLDNYFEQKTLLRTQLEARAMSVKEKRQEVLDFVARFGAKASKASQAQSRLKSLDRLETIELKPLSMGASVRIPPPSRAGKIIVTMKNVNLGYEDRVVLKDVTYTLENGDHLAVVGLNGAGKSTFLKSLAQVLTPLSGSVEPGYQVTIGYYAQHVAESLDPDLTVIDAMVSKAHPEVKKQEGLAMAGSLLFSGNDIYKKISVLSGGEKSRVALGQILLQKAPCLILDEPTNHLDFQTVEALTQALVSYEGTVAVVSHDRSFIRRIGTKILEINHGRVSLYPGTYDEYVWSLERGNLSQRGSDFKKEEKVKKNFTASEGNPYKQKEEKKMLERKLKNQERILAASDKNLNELNQQMKALSDNLTQCSSSEMIKFVNEISEIQKKIEVLESEWIKTSEEKEETKKSLDSLVGK